MERHYRITALRRFWWRATGKAIVVGAKTRLAPDVTLALSDGGSITIGKNCRIHRGVVIETHGGDVVIGDNVSLNPYCVVLGNGGVSIGDDTRIAAHSMIAASNHGFDNPDLLIRKHPMTAKGVSIGRDVWLGGGCRVLDGVEIGDGAVFGAGSVVKDNAARLSINVGVPARQIGWRGGHEPAELPESVPALPLAA